MVNHTRSEHHYIVVIITWLIILGILPCYGKIQKKQFNDNHYIMVFIPSMISHVIITTVYWCSFLVSLTM
jgi:hypothetical protein